MTPKEKAEELINKFKKSMEEADMYGFYNEATKQCALIAIDEIEKELIRVLGPHPNIIWYNYWQQIKQEIENYEL